MKEYQTSLYFLAKAWLCIVLIFPITLSKGYGQDKVRTYANFQGNLQTGLKVLGGSLIIGEILNANRAIDKDPRQASTLRIGAGLLGLASSTQFLEFTTNGNHTNVRTIPPNTPVYIKFTLPTSLIGLADGFSIGIFKSLKAVPADWPLFGLLGPGHNAGHDADYKKMLYSGASLLNLLNGAGELELTLTPNEEFQGIYLKLEGNALSVALSSQLFHAYILEDTVLPCDEKDKAIDILHGVRAGAASLANATGSVTNPWHAVDGDPNTFTLINTGAQVLSEVYHTTIFQTPSRPHQVAKIVLQKEGGGLLDLDLLNQFVIQPYLGSTAVGVPLSNSTLLSLRLLPGTGDIYELSVPVAGSFDRIEIKMGGVANVLNSLRVYEVSRLPELPILDEGSSPVGSDKDICKGDSAVLSAAAPSGATIKWYTQEYGGSIQGEGNQFTTPSLDADTIYYVSSAPEGCSTESPRIPIHIRVHPKPGVPHLILSNTQ